MNRKFIRRSHGGIPRRSDDGKENRMHKFFKIAIIFSLVLVLCCSLCACGANGKSAYELALENGFTGTEEEWRKSLNGADGATAYELAVLDGFEGTEEEWLASLRGKNGTNGKDGVLYEPSEDTPMGGQTAASNRALVQSVAIRAYEAENGMENATLGTGFVYSIVRNDEKKTADVLLVTAYRNIFRATNPNKVLSHIQVATFGKETYYREGDLDNAYVEASFCGGSVPYNLAVLSVRDSAYFYESAVQAVSFRSSDDVRVGEACFAVQYAGYDTDEYDSNVLSASSGIVSNLSEYAKYADCDNSDQRYRLLRADVPTNAGGMGGALFDRDGNVIGMTEITSGNVATMLGYKDSNYHLIEGVSLFTPSSVIEKLVRNMIDNDGALRKLSLGVSIAICEVDTVYNAETQQTIVAHSVFVTHVNSESPMYDYGGTGNNGLWGGDIIRSLQIEGQEEVELNKLYTIKDFLFDVRIGDTVHFLIERYNPSLKRYTTYIIDKTFTAGNFIVPTSLN